MRNSCSAKKQPNSIAVSTHTAATRVKGRAPISMSSLAAVAVQSVAPLAPSSLPLTHPRPPLPSTTKAILPVIRVLAIRYSKTRLTPHRLPAPSASGGVEMRTIMISDKRSNRYNHQHTLLHINIQILYTYIFTSRLMSKILVRVFN